MFKDKSFAHFVFPIAALLTLTPWVGSAGALVLGLVLALVFGNPYTTFLKNWTHRLLALAVVGLGAGVQLAVLARVGLQGVGYTVVGILLALGLGALIGKLLKTERDTSLLISVGTAICGGSAIAAVAPVIRAKSHEVSIALGIVFILNSCALILFPWIGHTLNLDQSQFGLWAALAIHDTSSVVGATLQYGPQALAIGTTTKLARALWIVPVAALIGFIRARATKYETPMEQSAPKPKARRPWFILGFLIMAALVTWIPDLAPLGLQIEAVAKKLMVLTLFFIGAGLTKQTLKSVGFKPFLQGILLWLAMSTISLACIYSGLIGTK